MTFLLTSIIVLYISFSVYLLLNKSNKPSNNNDEDGGIEINNTPDIDLPPGVTLPTDDKTPISK